MSKVRLLVTLILPVIAVSLSGCSMSGKPKEPTIIVPAAEQTPGATSSPVSNTQLNRVKERVDADPNLLRQCESLKDVPLGSNLDDLLAVHQKDAIAHGDCMRRTDSLIQLLKDAFNIKY